MARYTGSIARLSRREGIGLSRKGARVLERRPYPPGQHGQGRSKVSDYGVQLREKQKVKRIYGLLEKQFRRTFHEAHRMKGVTGENLLRLLEARLDNTVYRLNYANSRQHARQMIAHGHVRVNGHKVDVASYKVKVGDRIELSEKAKKNPDVARAMEIGEQVGVVPWLDQLKDEFAGVVKAQPARDELPLPVREVREQLIVELYSK